MVGCVKYIIYTLEGERLAYRYQPDRDDYQSGTVSFGGYTRCVHLMRKLAVEIYGIQKPRQPQLVQVNKCWLSFRSRYSEFCDSIQKLEAAHMILEHVRGFGNIVR